MRKALIVGINNYSSAPLSGCVNDANSIARLLESNEDQSPNFDVKLITSPNDSITKSFLRKSVEELFQGTCDIALFFFSGHGFIKNTGGYLVTTDYQRYDEGVSMDDLLNLANQSTALDKVIILDCCHSGAAGTPNITGSNLAQLSEGLTILTASRDSETAIEINGSGIFSSLVIDALKGGASDVLGNITPGSIYAYVDEALGAWDQRPIFRTNVTRFTSLRKVSPKVPLETLRKIIDYFPDPKEDHSLDPSYEFTYEGAIKENVAILKALQKYESVGLVTPVNEEHMYFAAMNSKSCRLTALGYQYWRLVKEKKI